jgi:hypothetical protein
MGAMMRHALRAFLVVLMLGAFGATISASELASAATLPAASSATPGVPASTIQVPPGGSTLNYCVSNYGPNTDVVVVDQRTGASKTIHTDGTGAGCTTFTVKRDCSATVSQTIVATGVDSTGKSATSQSTYNAAPDPALCPSVASSGPTAAGGAAGSGGGSTQPVSASGGSAGSGGSGTTAGSGGSAGSGASGGSDSGASGAGGTLAFTGADIAAMVLVAFALLAAGAVLVTVRRRRATPAA